MAVGFLQAEEDVLSVANIILFPDVDVLSVANIILFPAFVPTALLLPSVCFTKDVCFFTFSVRR